MAFRESGKIPVRPFRKANGRQKTCVCMYLCFSASLAAFASECVQALVRESLFSRSGTAMHVRIGCCFILSSFLATVHLSFAAVLQVSFEVLPTSCTATWKPQAIRNKMWEKNRFPYYPFHLISPGFRAWGFQIANLHTFLHLLHVFSLDDNFRCFILTLSNNAPTYRRMPCSWLMAKLRESNRYRNPIN